MRATFFLTLTLTVAPVALSAAEPIYVSFCGQVSVSEKMLSGAKEEIEIAYEEVGAAVHWVECDENGVRR